MSPTVQDLTPEQRETVRALQEELRGLDVQADAYWAQWLKTGDVECFNTVLAIESEIELKGLVAYMPKAGESRTGRIRDLVDKIRGWGDEKPVGALVVDEARFEARMRALESVNAFREDVGLPTLDRLPAGVVGDSSECTLARALKMGWNEHPKGWQLSSLGVAGGSGNELTYFNDKGAVVSVDFEAYGTAGWGEVVNDFDEYLFPDLIEDDDALMGVIGDRLDGGSDPNHDTQLRLALNEVERRGLVAEMFEGYSDIEHYLDYDPSGGMGPDVMRWRLKEMVD